ncbi:MAG: hypothetical protein KGJ57_06415 [Sphingomonadales bacterium]|nr:hypothetical protein [Sphingomonadales bacterium]MDE2169054.1 hypothetical protein [Sphingomonadales bacterium]
MVVSRWTRLATLAGVFMLVAPHGANAVAAPPPAPPSLAYADLVDLTDSSTLVVRAQIRDAILVPAKRAPDVKPGFARIYVEATPTEVLRGTVPSGLTELHYLADVPLGPKGKLPPYKKLQVLIYARPVRGSADVQLVAPDAQIVWSADLDARTRSLIAELSAPDAPPRVTGVTQALYEQGNLVGEGETQLFLSTATGQPATITVQHRPNRPTNWSVSFSEVVNPNGRPPSPDTLTWFRLACGLPRAMPSGINVSDNNDDRIQAEVDYSNVLHDLGPCERMRGH